MGIKKLTLAKIMFIISSGKFGEAKKEALSSEKVGVMDELLRINKEKNLVKYIGKMQADWNEKNYKEIARMIKNKS